MRRRFADVMDAWLARSDRRPLVLRGARQVGKTWLVRDLAARSGRRLVDLNLEQDPSWARAFDTNEVRAFLSDLSLRLGHRVDAGTCMLFLDEIQAVPSLLAKLRWLYEDAPDLPVVAAGSLLEFVLGDHAMSMPVGRVRFENVEPVSFEEYLGAHGQDELAERMVRWRAGAAWSAIAHEQATRWFERYAMIGGMPSVVDADVHGASPRECRRLQADLVATYRADFAKYRGRLDRTVLDAVLQSVARSVGEKFVYARVGDGVKQPSARLALERLAEARICHIAPHSAANGLPLGAEANPRHRKVSLVDVGLLHALLGTPADDSFPPSHHLSAAMRGQLADQLVAQQLRLTQPSFGGGPELHHWRRGGGRPGEIDFIVPLQGRVVPIEVKAGAAGAMKSLHRFVHAKGLHFAVRCDANPPSVQRIQVKTTEGNPVAYDLLSVPLYLVWNLDSIVRDLIRG
ncbi:MAG: AAA family ATPase [Myxococcota bacterium]